MFHTLVDVDRLILVWEAEVFTQGFLYQLTGTSHYQLIRQVEELRRQSGDKTTDGTVGIVAPLCIFALRILEEIEQRLHAKLFIIESCVIAMTYQVELSLYIVQTCIDRCCRKHQDFHITILLPLLVLDKFRHQFLVSARLLITQVMALVYDYQYLLSRLQIVQLGIIIMVQSVALHIGMETNDIVELIFLKTRTCATEILCPVLLQLLRTEQDGEVILCLEIFDDRQSRESLTKTYGIGKDGTIIFTEHFYQREITPFC